MKKNTLQEQAIIYAEEIANKVSNRFGLDEDMREDMKQDAIVKALEVLKGFNPARGCELNTYLQKRVEGYLIDRLASYGRSPRNEDGEPIVVRSVKGRYDNDAEERIRWEEMMPDLEAEKQRAHQEDLEDLRRVLMLLPDGEREIVMVRFQYEEVHETVEQYAERKGICVATFYNMADEVLLKLRRLMTL